MVEAELLIGHLRSQVRNLQSLLNYLESRQHVEQDDHAYSQTKLREMIERLRKLEHFSSTRGAVHRLRAAWLN